MGYTFRGLLTLREEAAVSLMKRWPDCKVRRELTQVDAFVIRFPCENDLHPMQSADEFDKVLDEIEQLKAALPLLSAEFPNEMLVYVEVECFGGTCDHTGMHLMDGRVIAKFEHGPSEVDLAEILRPLGVVLDDNQYFRPFTRGYFERDALQSWNRAWPPVGRHENKG